MCADAWDATLSRDAARDRARHGEREPRRGEAGPRRHTPGRRRRGSLVATSWLQHSAGKELLGAWREMNPRLPGLAADVLEQDQRDIPLGVGGGATRNRDPLRDRTTRCTTRTVRRSASVGPASARGSSCIALLVRVSPTRRFPRFSIDLYRERLPKRQRRDPLPLESLMVANGGGV